METNSPLTLNYLVVIITVLIAATFLAIYIFRSERKLKQARIMDAKELRAAVLDYKLRF